MFAAALKIGAFNLLSETPASAPRDSLAGQYMGWSNVDLRTEIDACFPLDQEYADTLAEIYKAIVARDYAKVAELSAKDVQYYDRDFKNCEDVKEITDVKAAEDKQRKEFMKLPNWQQIELRNVATQEYEDAHNDWSKNMEAGDYYNAGIALGKMNAMKYKMPTYISMLMF